MSRRLLVIGLAATAGVLASSCASTARDTLVDIYDDEATASDVSEPCRIEALTFETATQAFVAQYGQPPTAESDLVPELVRESPENWRFDAGVATSFVPISGGRCDGYEVEPGDSPSIGQLAVDSIDDSRSASCAIDKRQIETAVETHFAFNGFDAT
ncbi:MAG: hypothetical protein WA964_17720, partial [Ilumatobacter sp.]|uniref:hypothetical protein n=1 Tax=Ilumatobacter sp. TaxID=1967498 RepID=UPI003C75235D